MDKVRCVKKRKPQYAYQIDEDMDIDTLEGKLHAKSGDWIMHGINGEKYPIRDDIFKKTYDILDFLKP